MVSRVHGCSKRKSQDVILLHVTAKGFVFTKHAQIDLPTVKSKSHRHSRFARGPAVVDQEHSPLLTNMTPCPCQDTPNPIREATGTAAITVNELGTTMQVYGV